MAVEHTFFATSAHSLCKHGLESVVNSLRKYPEVEKKLADSMCGGERSHGRISIANFISLDMDSARYKLLDHMSLSISECTHFVSFRRAKMRIADRSEFPSFINHLRHAAAKLI